MGYYGWQIYRDLDEKTWILQDDNGDPVANTTLGIGQYPMGKKIWITARRICEYSKYEQITLLLSACEDDQFTCNNFECIHEDRYCDGHSHCSDFSDETQCKTYTIPDSYSKQIYVHHEKLNVDIEVQIIRLIHVDDVRNTIAIEYNCSAIWTDDRLIYYNLNENPVENQSV